MPRLAAKAAEHRFVGADQRRHLNDLSRSLIALEQDATLIAVIGMGQSSWLVGPGSRSKPGEPGDLAYDAEPHRFTPGCVRCGCDGCCADGFPRFVNSSSEM